METIKIKYFSNEIEKLCYIAGNSDWIDLRVAENVVMKKGEFSQINEILKENIHKYGKMKTPKEIIKDMTGKDFDSQYYIDYLKEKFSEIYGLDK